MIRISVENMNVDDFLERLKNGFTDIDECDQWVRDFFVYYERQLKRKFKLSQEAEQEKCISKYEKAFEEEFQEVMLAIDDCMVERREYLDRIATKNKYRGRYNYKKKK